MIAKFFKRRDSATAWLRKQGVANTEYNTYITPGNMDGEDGFCCTFPDPVPAAKPVEQPSLPVKPVDESKKKEVVIEERKTSRTATPAIAETATEAIRRMIRAGSSNAEIWEVVKKQFNLDDKKKYYPAWYRFDLRRKGEKV